MRIFRHKSLGQIGVHHSSVSIAPYGRQVNICRHGTPQNGYYPNVTNRTYTATNSSMARIMRLVNDYWQYRVTLRSYPQPDTWISR